MKRVDLTIFKALMLVVAFALGATSCEKETPIAKLPDAVVVECNAGEKPTLSFTADEGWQLSSDQLWCKFITSAGELQEMAGGAGQHTVTLKITDDNNSTKDWSTANITMKMGGNTAIIATIKRMPSQLYMNIYNITGEKQKAFELGYVSYIPMKVEANFRFAATDIPNWVEVAQYDENHNIVVTNAITGTPGESTEVLLRIVNNGDRERYPITVEDGHVIKFSDEEGTADFEFPITFNGMGNDKLTFTGPTALNYGWEVSLDGKTFRQLDESNETTTTLSDKLEFKITAQDNIYNILYIEQKIERGMSSFEHIGTTLSDPTLSNEEDSWMHFNMEDMTLTIEESQTPRYGLVMALPEGVYKNIQTDILGSILDVDTASGIELPTINDAYREFVIIEFAQRDFKERGAYEGMYIYHSITALEILANEYDNSELMAQYSVEECFICPFINPIEGKKPGIVIDPRIEGWDTLSFEEGTATVELHHNGQQLKMSDDEYYTGENTDENMAIYLWGPKDGWNDADVHIVFKVGGQAKKLLVVTPPTK